MQRKLAKVPLCVPWEKQQVVRALGAVFDKTTRRFTIQEDMVNLPAIRPYLPLRWRPGLRPPYIRIGLIPQMNWRINLRSLLTPAEWDQVRKKVYQSTGYSCLVCGGRGEKWPVEADEVWKFSEAEMMQTLVDVVPLCPACHEVRHLGLAQLRGRYNYVLQHMVHINRWSIVQAIDYAEQAIHEYEERLAIFWDLDFTPFEEKFGYKVPWENEPWAGEEDKVGA